jgi:hypothetical protein
MLAIGTMMWRAAARWGDHPGATAALARRDPVRPERHADRDRPLPRPRPGAALRDHPSVLGGPGGIAASAPRIGGVLSVPTDRLRRRLPPTDVTPPFVVFARMVGPPEPEVRWRARGRDGPGTRTGKSMLHAAVHGARLQVRVVSPTAPRGSRRRSSVVTSRPSPSHCEPVSATLTPPLVVRPWIGPAAVLDRHPAVRGRRTPSARARR